MTSMKDNEYMSNETMLVIAGLLLKFTIMKMKGPNKPLNQKTKKSIKFWETLPKVVMCLE